MKKIRKSILMAPFLLWFCLTAVHPAFSQELVYRLKWKFNASVAGDIFAVEKGYFKKAGLDIDVREGGAGINSIAELELGRSGFGVASADQVILALEKGAKIYVLAQLFQVNPLQWIYRAKTGALSSLASLKGLRIGVTYGGNDEAVMNTLLARGGLTTKDVRIISVRGDAIPFFRGKADIWPVYINSQGVKYEADLAREGEAVRFFEPARFGVNFVANSVITSRRMIKEHPDQVRLFLEALLSAWEAAMDPENETAVLAALEKFDRGNAPDIQERQLAATRKLVKPGPQVKIGTIDAAAWEQTRDIMLSEKIIKDRVKLKDRLVFNFL